MTGKPKLQENPERPELSLRQDIGATMHPCQQAMRNEFSAQIEFTNQIQQINFVVQRVLPVREKCSCVPMILAYLLYVRWSCAVLNDKEFAY